MEYIYYKIIFGILVPLLAVVFCLYDISRILGWLRGKIKSHIEKNLNSDKFIIQDDEIKEKVDRRIAKLKINALAQAILVESRSSGLSFLTRTASLIELIIFIGLTLILLYYENNLLEAVKVFGAFFGGWLGIKVLVSHSAWSDPYVGKGYYYISLFGTLINVIIGVLISLFLHKFIF